MFFPEILCPQCFPSVMMTHSDFLSVSLYLKCDQISSLFLRPSMSSSLVTRVRFVCCVFSRSMRPVTWAKPRTRSEYFKAVTADEKAETIVDENEERFYLSFYFMQNIFVSSFFVNNNPCWFSLSQRFWTVVQSCHRLVLVMKKKVVDEHISSRLVWRN